MRPKPPSFCCAAGNAPPAVRRLAMSIAPWNPNLGVMLPYTPLHHLLLRELRFPVVATSGNLSDEPLCTDEHEALERLHGIADVFLVHDRPIVRHVDDSVVRVVLDRELVLRRARGYAPLPVPAADAGPGKGLNAEGGQMRAQSRHTAILAVGAHLKNTVALAIGPQVFISQHIGDLETRQAYSAFCRTAADLQRLYDAKPSLVVCDLHPEYLSTKYAAELGGPVLAIQHHYAHVAACMAENELEGPVLGVSWDGTGYGTDGTIWGGEFLLTDETSFTRVAHLRQFSLPGGEAAIKEPRRTALGLLYALLGAQAFLRHDLFPVRSFTASELAVLRQMLERGVQCPVTSSAGRLFDAVASLVGLRQRVRFEGQAAMELEFALEAGRHDAYPMAIKRRRPADRGLGTDGSQASAGRRTGRDDRRHVRTVSQCPRRGDHPGGAEGRPAKGGSHWRLLSKPLSHRARRASPAGGGLSPLLAPARAAQRRRHRPRPGRRRDARPARPRRAAMNRAEEVAPAQVNPSLCRSARWRHRPDLLSACHGIGRAIEYNRR